MYLENGRFFLYDKLPMILLGICIFTFYSMVSNAKIRIFSFEEKVSLSDTIVIGKVIETNKRLFRKDLVVVEPIRIVKGNLDNDLIRITIKKIPEKLVSGEIFVFFLKKGEVYYDLFATFQGYYHVKNDGFAYYGSDKIPLEDLIRKIEEQGELQTK